MSTSANNEEEKIFEFYTCLPQEVRTVMIDEMQPDDRCRFTRCSKLSQNEARASKKFIYSIIFAVKHENAFEIRVQHSNYGILHKNCGFRLQIDKMINQEKIIRCEELNGKFLWTMELSKSTNLLKFSFQEFNRLLKTCQNSIKSLTLWGHLLNENWEDVAFKDGISHLKNLEALKVYIGVDVRPIFAKLRSPLKELTMRGMKNIDPFSNCEEVYQVQNELQISSLKLNNDQFLNLSASKIDINIGNLTAQDIVGFIKMWQNGMIRENFEKCSWNLEDSDFDAKPLFDHFGGVGDDYSDRKVEVKNNKEPSRKAKLNIYNGKTLIFTTRDQKCSLM